MQNLTTIFRQSVVSCDMPIRRIVMPSPRVFDKDDGSASCIMLGFKNEKGGQALAYWKAVNLMTETFEGTISFQLGGEKRAIHLIDLMTGEIYDLPDSMKVMNGTDVVSLLHLPLTDSPLLLTFGDFVI